jgi:hypothetical protein
VTDFLTAEWGRDFANREYAQALERAREYDLAESPY